jgi:hypothetical protein
MRPRSRINKQNFRPKREVNICAEEIPNFYNFLTRLIDKKAPISPRNPASEKANLGIV